jgi:hypothetical protein
VLSSLTLPSTGAGRVCSRRSAEIEYFARSLVEQVCDPSPQPPAPSEEGCAKRRSEPLSSTRRWRVRNRPIAAEGPIRCGVCGVIHAGERCAPGEPVLDVKDASAQVLSGTWR